MKYAHLIKLRVFSYEHENSHEILEHFLKFFPFNIEDNKVEVKKTYATGFNESKIEILEAALTKTNLIKQFIKNISEKLEESQKLMILNQIESRLDSNLDFFLRFDKESWIHDKKLSLTDSGKCFHLKISIAAFPRKREVALKIIKELFEK